MCCCVTLAGSARLVWTVSDACDAHIVTRPLDTMTSRVRYNATLHGTTLHYFMFRCALLHFIMFRSIPSRRVAARRGASRRVASRHGSARLGSARHVTSRHVTSRHITSRHVSSRHVTSRHVTSRHSKPHSNLQGVISTWGKRRDSAELQTWLGAGSFVRGGTVVS